MEMPRLLLVEDHPDNLELIAAVLGERYRVFGYASAQEALAALEAAQRRERRLPRLERDRLHLRPAHVLPRPPALTVPRVGEPRKGPRA
jgi:CheY-like chemotaxis protein